MKKLTVLLALAVAFATSACAYDLGEPYDGLTVPGTGRAVASVSQDAGLSLAIGAAAGTSDGFFYDWRRRDYEQRVQAAARRERQLQLQAQAQAGAMP